MIDLDDFESYIAGWDSLLAGVEQLPSHNHIQDRAFELTRRAAIVRQREALAAMISMSRAGHGAFAVPLLRPAFEELVWIEYLNRHADVADEILQLQLRDSVAASLEAQRDYAGPKGMLASGIPNRFAKRTIARRPDTQKALEALGAKLGWDGKKRRSPTFRFLCVTVGRTKEYEFLYHGTSRSVHFSVVELWRRAWGESNEVTISTGHFSRYWQDFALYWGSYIFFQTLCACEGDLTGSIEQKRFDEMLAVIERHLREVPIITGAELNLDTQSIDVEADLLAE